MFDFQIYIGTSNKRTHDINPLWDKNRWSNYDNEPVAPKSDNISQTSCKICNGSKIPIHFLRIILKRIYILN